MIHEIIRPLPDRMSRFALFDFDGTVSLLREGWQEIMYTYFTEILCAIPNQTETPEELRAVVVDFVDRLTGKQTIFQAIQLADEIQKRGGIPEDPGVYKAEYLRRLMEQIHHRHEALQNGASPEPFLVPGVKNFLEYLNSREITCYLASGTDADDVQREVELLGLTPYFVGVFGAEETDRTACSKEKVLKNLFETHNLRGADLLSFGDGYVEIELTRQLDGYAVGVATDEHNRSGKPDAWKRNRLLEAGADTIWADFTHGKEFFE
ncbi:MAG: HAD hydrolase-like protein [Planctomycetia bacterium]|nr:HAD hydrolase-like protein [Planctomycetia bacterium]